MEFDFIKNGLSTEGFDFSDDQIKQWAHYLKGIQLWNKAYNLTSIVEPEEMLVKHLFDSIVLIPHLEKIKHDRMIDVGTGAGLPGFILAIAMPDTHFVLLDTNSKRTRFMTQMKLELGIKNIEIVHSRVQDYQPAELFDVILSRAFASAEDMVIWSKHLLTDDGCFAAMKGHVTPGEWQFAEEGYKSTIIKLSVPRLDEARHLVILS
ncbi:16S rRNA (guanine(527)-N(7))-methyltransferase RsmG [Wohlfahrtiimonas larvae]|uniref:Ribosomal RNA small subunit methyltransferase G n=1 Tax=Wohlfahrtiimonas larvae TaxID=1157986 RepID=A0ABP9MC64_9GAMM|nr:16S rRNA (guanine(527)-N(7))-methyltransferase RsmG [Wohlfahrtiimonas larvae]